MRFLLDFSGDNCVCCFRCWASYSLDVCWPQVITTCRSRRLVVFNTTNHSHWILILFTVCFWHFNYAAKNYWTNKWSRYKNVTMNIIIVIIIYYNSFCDFCYLTKVKRSVYFSLIYTPYFLFFNLYLLKVWWFWSGGEEPNSWTNEIKSNSRSSIFNWYNVLRWCTQIHSNCWNI